jgi:hypothetical protein
MATADLSAFFAAINKQMTEQSAAFAAELFARLLGYENALIAIIAALDRSGALPIAEAK